MVISPKIARSDRKFGLNSGSSVIAFAAVMLLAQADAAQAEDCDPTSNPSGAVCTGPVTPSGSSYTNAGTIDGGLLGVALSADVALTTLTNTDSGTINGTSSGLSNEGIIGTLTNSGTISGGGTGIFNNINGTITGLTNSGSITALGFAGVLNYGSIVDFSNEATGSITGKSAGIWNDGAITTLTNDGSIISEKSGLGNRFTIDTLINSGSITGTTGSGVWILPDGSIENFTNEATGSVSGGTAGFYNEGTIDTLTNSGALINAIGGVITGGEFGIDNRGTITTLNNSGYLISTKGDYDSNNQAALRNSSTITTVNNSGTMSGPYGIFNTPSGSIDTINNTGEIIALEMGLLNDGSINILSNSGTISASLYGAIMIREGGIISDFTNLESGIISGDDFAVWNLSEITSFTNSGEIRSTGSSAIANSYNIGSLTNTTSGSISGGNSGLSNGGSIGTLTNSGAISGEGSGIYNNGTITLLTNSGTISGTGRYDGIWNAESGLIVALDNAAGGQITGVTAGLYNDGTVTTLTNMGTITSEQVGIRNNDTITTLINAQGGTDGALTYAGNLPGSYQAYITSPTQYGQLIYTDGNGTLPSFSVADGSSLALGTYTNILSGISSITDGLQGAFGGLRWGLLNTSGTDWDLVAAMAGEYGLVNADGETISALSNLSGGILSGSKAGVSNSGTISSLSNDGTIGSRIDAKGLANELGGVIEFLGNQGSITGRTTGLYNNGLIEALANSGTITGVMYPGIWNDSTGTFTDFTNEATGTITGGSAGIWNDGLFGTLANSGVITGAGNAGIFNGRAGALSTLANAEGGIISGATAGVYNEGTIDALTNSGLINSPGTGDVLDIRRYSGIRNVGFIDAITNNATGTISGYAGIYNDTNVTIASITNSGAISGTGTGMISADGDYQPSTYVGIFNQTGATITLIDNKTGGTITGADTGIDNKGTITTLTNSGTIEATDQYTGVWNRTGATIGALNNTESGNITGVSAGVYNNGTIAALTNAGTISASTGSAAFNSGEVTALTNSGNIVGGSYGLNNVGGGVITTLTNMGTISGGTVGIRNDGTISTLINAQGGADGPLTYSGFLPGTYQAYFTSLTHYGQLSYLDGNGTLASFGFADGSSLATGIYTDVLKGISSIEGDLTGVFDGLNWTLINSGENWQLKALPGPVGTMIINSDSVEAITNTGTIAYDLYGLRNDSTGTIATLTNAIDGVLSGTKAGVSNGGSITTLTNSGTLGGSVDQFGLQNEKDSTIETLTNQGTITANTTGIINSGTITTLTNSGSITGTRNSGVWNTSDGTITTFTNEATGTVYGGTGAFYNDGTITTLTNLGSITGDTALYNNASITTLTNMGTISGETYDLYNVGTIGTLINAQGGTDGALTYSGTLADSYQTYITSLTRYGQLSYLDGNGALASFGIAAGSSLAAGTYANVLSGIATMGGDLNGTLGNFRWALVNTSGSDWSLAIGNALDYGLSNPVGETITTLTNLSGSVLSGSKAGVINYGAITALSNDGVIGSLIDANGLVNKLSGSIDSLTNQGEIAGQYSGIYNVGTISALVNSETISGGSSGITNSGTITLLTNSGTVIGTTTYEGIWNDGSGVIESLVNETSGVISGVDAGLYNDGTVTTLTNMGSISGESADIKNYGTITTFINAQGGTNGALTYSSVLPTSYFTYITSLTQYGQLSYVERNGALASFGIAAGSSLAVGTYNSILSGISSIDGDLTGVFGNVRWTLTNSSGEDWDLSAEAFANGNGSEVAAGTTVDALNNVIGGVLSGSIAGISNNGTITLLSNAGTIEGATAGIANQGTLTEFSNTGTIGGSTTATGIANAIGGTVGTLTNASGGTVSGTEVGVSNSGTITILSNAGAVEGQTAGIANAIGGTVGTLTNASGGTVSGTVAGVSNSGTITILSNAGAVEGHTAGIANAGTLTAVSNTGTIGGSTTATGISNAIGGSVGTLTNASGGTVTGTAAGIGNSGTIALVINQGALGGSYSTYGLQNQIGATVEVVTNESGGAILGSEAGIANAGTIGQVINAGSVTTLINSGTLGGDNSTYGLQNQNGGTVGALINAINGTVTGTVAGISNTGTIASVSNFGTITGGEYGLFNAAGSLVLLNNGGTLGGSGGSYGIGNGAGSTIQTIINAAGATVTGTEAGIRNNGTIINFNNDGKITGGGNGTMPSSGTPSPLATLSTNGVSTTGMQSTLDTIRTMESASPASGLHNLAGGTFTTLTNGGTIGGSTFGIENAGTISTLNNKGTITGGTAAIKNTGTIRTLVNQQGGSIGALTYSGALPLAYVQHVTSVTRYGQLSYAGTDSKLSSYAVAADSNLVVGSYANVLTGIGSVDGTTKAQFSELLRWRLVKTSATSWSLLVRRYPEKVKMLTELGYTRDEILAALRNRAATTNMALANDCGDFSPGGFCLSSSLRYSSFDGANEMAGVVTAAYRIAPNVRIGGFLDYAFNRNSAATRLKNERKLPMFGGFMGYGRADGMGLQLRVSGAYSAENVTITRSAALETIEPGSGTSRLKNWAIGGEASYAFKATPQVRVMPYVGLRYGYAGRRGYAEQQTELTEFPVTYAAYSQSLTTARAGVNLAGNVGAKLAYRLGAGLEYDLTAKATTFAGSSEILHLETFSLANTAKAHRLRAATAAELAYAVTPAIKVTLGAGLRQEAYSNASQSHVTAGLRIGF